MRKREFRDIFKTVMVMDYIFDFGSYFFKIVPESWRRERTFQIWTWWCPQIRSRAQNPEIFEIFEILDFQILINLTPQVDRHRKHAETRV